MGLQKSSGFSGFCSWVVADYLKSLSMKEPLRLIVLTVGTASSVRLVGFSGSVYSEQARVLWLHVQRASA